MHKIFACMIVVGVSACASQESTERHTRPQSARHRTHERAVVVNDGEAPREKVVVNERRVVDERQVVVQDREGVDPVPVAPVRVAEPSPNAVPDRADNTALNERDRDRRNLTPADQRNNASDTEITQRIRKAVVADNSLTSAAKNVKIITESGLVTLRGSVRDTQEKNTVEAYAREVAGVGNVKNQLDVVR